MITGIIIPYLIPPREAFEQHADAENAKAMEAYMKWDFPFFGIKATHRRALLSAFLKEHGMQTPFDPEVLRRLWNAPHRGFHHNAVDIMEKQIRSIKESDLSLIEEFIVTNS